jgi:threonine aldolase
MPAARNSLGPVHLRSDGLLLSPADHAALLVSLTARGSPADAYGVGGAVTHAERKYAAALGKESAVFLPTGILANHLALRQLSPARARVLVHANSHLYMAEVEGVPRLSGISLTPIASPSATFTLAQVRAEIARAKSPPHPVRVGAISIETPARRLHGTVFDFDEMRLISREARRQEIGLHLDGARLFIASAYTGISPARYAALFDTVYVSTYKCFNAPQGAILAGPSALIEAVRTERKLFGGDVHQAWPSALVAAHFLDGFPRRFAVAMQRSRVLFALLNRHPRLRVEAMPEGTNVFKLHVTGKDPARYAAALARRGHAVRLQNNEERFGGVWLVVNESLNLRPAAVVATEFIAALR